MSPSTCFLQELQALEGTPVVFKLDASTGRVATVEIYYYPGVVAKKEAEGGSQQGRRWSSSSSGVSAAPAAAQELLFDRGASDALLRALGAAAGAA